MGSADDVDAHAEIGALRRQADAGRRRAARAASIAARHEASAAQGSESVRSLHARMADLHRQIEARHLEAVRITELHASRMARWLDHSGGQALRPVFMAAVADALGMPSASATLRGQRHAAVIVAVSDATARAAHELETVMAEGPAADAATAGTPITAAGTELLDRWPRYGSAIAELGVRAVIAAPLGRPGKRLGALCGYAAEPAIPAGMSTATSRIADALTQVVLRTAQLPGSGEDFALLPLFDESSFQVVVHQAAGMVSEQCDCGVDDAEDLLTARAFAEGRPVEEIAREVVRRQTRFS